MRSLDVPLARSADDVLRKLAHVTDCGSLSAIDGATLLCERAMLAGFKIPSHTSAGGGSRLLAAKGDSVALNLARVDDRELLPALFASEALNPNDDESIAAHVARSHASALVMRGRELGLAIAAEHESLPADTRPVLEMTAGLPAESRIQRTPRVLDLSALWAGPLAAHLLWLAGAQVEKVESLSRRDAMRDGDNAFFALLNQGKASVALNLTDERHRRALLASIAQADIVIEAARPRALAQLGIDADHLVRTTPGLVWITITGHGATDPAANWIGFGDDCAVAGGLSAALREACGRTGFVGDAIADPLTGMFAAHAAAQAWHAGRGGRFALAMSHVVAYCLASARARDAQGLSRSLIAWSNAEGEAFPTVEQRHQVAALSHLGEHTDAFLARADRC